MEIVHQEHKDVGQLVGPAIRCVHVSCPVDCTLVSRFVMKVGVEPYLARMLFLLFV